MENKEIESKNEKPSSKEVMLTEANWLFIKHIRNGMKVREAYLAAGYKGDPNTEAYNLNSRLKDKLKEIVQADGFNKTRLAIEMDKILSLPLELNKQEVTLTEKLKSIRLAHTIMSEDTPKSHTDSFTMIVIGNQVPIVDMPPSPSGHAEVVDVTEIRQEGDEPKA